MALDEQRLLLEQLMGMVRTQLIPQLSHRPGREGVVLLRLAAAQERDVAVEERTGKTRKFTDHEICKYHICGLSPYFLFKNTKSVRLEWEQELARRGGEGETDVNRC